MPSEKNSFAQQLRSGRGVLGAWCTFASFASTEVMTELGFDFLVLDLQHCELTQSQFPAMLGAFREGSPTPVVRAPQNDYHIINWLLDQGAPAVLVPMVNSAEAARAAVDAAKFPPLGRRSFGPYRAARYSFGVTEYMPRADELATLIVQIESEDAARNIDSILAVQGIDAIFVGPNDLAFSMLRPGHSFFGGAASTGAEGASQWTGFARTPEVLRLCDEMLAKCKAAGIPFGMTSSSMAEAREWFDKGANLMTFGSDFLFMRAGARYLRQPEDAAKA
jgi:2-keto-3-deoxy-L-rhamnonate aldolase RhmA